jgi:hypothetical protein
MPEDQQSSVCIEATKKYDPKRKRKLSRTLTLIAFSHPLKGFAILGKLVSIPVRCGGLPDDPTIELISPPV